MDPNDPMDLSALLGSVTPGPDAQADAMRRLGTLYRMTGNKGLSSAGEDMVHEADQRRAVGLSAPQRAQQALGAQQALMEEQAWRNPASQSVLRGAVQKFMPGLSVDDNTPVQVLRNLMPVAEKFAQAQQLADWRKTLLGQKADEVGATQDAMGNPILYRKHGGSGPLDGVQRLGAGAAPAGGAPGGLLTPEALDQAADQYAATGQLPNLGRGKAGPLIQASIANRAAERHPDSNLALNKAGFHAGSASLGKMQTQADAVDAFERTAMANLDQFLQTAHGAIDTGSPLLNMPARKFAQAVAGDPKMTEFNVARQVAVQEVGKVLSGSMGNAAVSDSARKEVEELLSPDASIDQIERAAGILRRDMQNRKAAMSAQLGEMRSRIGGKAPAAEPAATTSLKPTHRWNPTTNKLEVISGG